MYGLTAASPRSAAITPIQLDLIPGRACPLEAKPATARNTARRHPRRRGGVQDGGTRRQHIKLTGETLFGPAEEIRAVGKRIRENPKAQQRSRAGNRRWPQYRGTSGKPEGGKGRYFHQANETGKGSRTAPAREQPRTRQARRKAPARLDNARKLQRTLYRVAKRQPTRRFTLLYDKVCRQDILQEAWKRVKSNKGAAGVDQVEIDAIRDYGEDRFLNEVEQELRSRRRIMPMGAGASAPALWSFPRCSTSAPITPALADGISHLCRPTHER